MVYRVSESPIPPPQPNRPQITGPRDVAALSCSIVGLRQEHFQVVLLDARHRLLLRATVSKGTLSSALVHPRDVFREAIRRNAAAIVLVHNHPSGDPAPSGDDMELTRRLAKIGALVGIDVLDHVIVAKEGYVSLREQGNVFNERSDECSSQAASTRSRR